MQIIAYILITLLDVYAWIIIGTVIVSWLVAFQVLNAKNTYVYKFCVFLNWVTNPVIMRVRKYVPPISGIDLSPVVVIVAIYILQGVIYQLAY